MPYDTLSVGRLLDPRDTDKRFTDASCSNIEHEALTYARKWAAEDRRSAIAIWKKNEVFLVLLNGLELKPMVG